ncbi:hypothetical protein LTR70_009276 [Exophiala xenobiotica]|uniref:ABM domain-containing protein n=1 Tax=Lithohypha guttulata TaxID=1690604 RepID=A0ABR0JY25_9EURO|nr:hypothetical protein LTR24_009128 [Lithohypha guttulata]KAK5310709.1 hypothetical protein LTR70_009276 [Exophiala xenobiotica]
MVLDVIVIITPAKGKETRVEELIGQQVEGIKKNEPGVLFDRCYRRTDLDDGTEFVIVQRYKDEAAYNAHFHTEHRKDLPATIRDEELMGKPMVYMKLEPIQYGFER